MKNYNHLLSSILTLGLLILLAACSKETSIEEEPESGLTLELSFQSGTISERIFYEKGEWFTESDNLLKIEYVDSETGNLSYGFAFSNKSNKLKSSGRKSQQGSVERGLYGWDGTCFVWGTLYTGDNGESIFIAADVPTQNLLNVCPDEGSAFAENTRTQNTTKYVN